MVNGEYCLLFSSVNVGQASSTLVLHDGKLRLTYTGGDHYNDDAHTPRMSVITFVCDPSATDRQPKFLEESDHMYTFMWLTHLACPQKPMECTVVDANGKQYDLSRYGKPICSLCGYGINKKYDLSRYGKPVVVYVVISSTKSVIYPDMVSHW